MAIQPTNAGINYQQRVAAQFLSLMLTDSSLEPWLSGSEGILESIRFESSDEIDDLVLENDQGDNYYIQIKRTISLSNKQNSHFYKVIMQFVGEYISTGGKGKYYLAISSSASSSIGDRLRRILDNIRNNQKIDGLYLNKTDQSILDTFLSAISFSYKARLTTEISDTDLLQLCMHIYIVVYDVENELHGERACKMLLASHCPVEYDVLWRSLIVDSLEFAENRSSVARNFLHEKYRNILTSTEKDQFFAPVLEGEVQIGYDIILGRSPQLLEIVGKSDSNMQQYSDDPLLLLQLYRFDDSGKKQISKFYPDNRLIMPGNVEVKVIHRCSSIAGMERFIETYRPKGSSVIEMLGKGTGQEDHFPEAQLHKQWVTEQLTKGTDLHCIHCGEPIAGEKSCMIEIDNDVERLKVGYAHIGCTRPVDRVLGLLKGKVFNEYCYLKTFDYAFWANAKGQRVFGQLQAMGIRMGSILWNRDIHSILTGRFCMKANLEQGDYTYVTQRGYVVRGSQAHLKSQVKLHNKILEKTKHDPMGFASITHTFGNYSGLIDKLEVGEEFRRCISFECVPYTSTIHELFDIDVKEDYYCPLIYLTIDGEIFEVGGHIFMLTNPLDLQKYLDNWKEKLGFDIGSDYCVVTIKHDTEFDNFVQDALNDGFKIIVDPWFGNYSDLARGYSIKSYDAEVTEKID